MTDPSENYTLREWALIILGTHTRPTATCESCGTDIALRETATDAMGAPSLDGPDHSDDAATRIAEVAAVRLVTPTRREWMELVPNRHPVSGRVSPVLVVHTPERCRAVRGR